MLKIIVAREWQTIWRSKTLTAGWLFLLIMLGIAFAGTQQQVTRLAQQRAMADSLFRYQWTQLKAENPHSAAHFGTYIYKPVSTLSVFDNGIHHFSGYTLRVEAHVQHMLAAAPATPADNYLRFGEFSMATVLQLFFPLLIIFFCYNSYVQEREQGTLKILLLQGAGNRLLLTGKALSGLLISNAMLLVSLVIFFSILFLFNKFHSNTDVTAACLLMLAYAVYASILVLCCIIISFLSKTGRQALIILLGAWLAGAVLIPRMAATAGNILYPLPSWYELQESISRAEKFGIDGKEPREQRQEKLTAAWLKKYHVKTVNELPVNFDAIQMQAAEEYMQQIYDRHIAAIDSIIRHQNNIIGYAAILNPYLAIQHVSMGLSGSDYQHHAHFFAAARLYRNNFIRRLNEQLAYGGSKTGDHNWKADAAFFRKMPVFKYRPPSLQAVLLQQLPYIALLIAWLLAGYLLLIRLSSNESVI
ncbi:DUF3526 domain-containing protein [Chitinophaga sp. 212800010-3]|uniref:DUF3526 domain-containing protein n=1 Tax=unclassified Chitinophaga TaxID=2619133 RepID=UPI002DF4502F|nr:DUF3526 domain-containing protein [Chitinophaga sp. 212800010-3]